MLRHLRGYLSVLLFYENFYITVKNTVILLSGIVLIFLLCRIDQHSLDDEFNDSSEMPFYAAGENLSAHYGCWAKVQGHVLCHFLIMMYVFQNVRL